MINPIISFCIKLILLLGVVFGIHIALLHYLNLPKFENLIIPSYIVNSLLAIVIYSTLYKLKIKYLDLLGYIFMGGSLIKFAVFLIFFNPIYKENGNASAIETTSFLVPYLICLIVETFYLIKLLNSKI